VVVVDEKGERLTRNLESRESTATQFPEEKANQVFIEEPKHAEAIHSPAPASPAPPLATTEAGRSIQVNIETWSKQKSHKLMYAPYVRVPAGSGRHLGIWLLAVVLAIALDSTDAALHMGACKLDKGGFSFHFLAPHASSLKVELKKTGTSEPSREVVLSKGDNDVWYGTCSDDEAKSGDDYRCVFTQPFSSH